MSTAYQSRTRTSIAPTTAASANQPTVDATQATPPVAQRDDRRPERPDDERDEGRQASRFGSRRVLA